MTMTKLIIFGCGYTGSELAAQALGRGWSVTVTKRTLPAPSPKGLESATWLSFDAADPEPFADPDRLATEMAAATHIVSTIAPMEGADPVLAHAGTALETAAGRGAWLGYVSATSVYGDWEGAWVDEDTPCRPGTRRGRERRAAEEAWEALAARAGAPLALFRAAGIYGPGRNPLETLKADPAKPVIKSDQVFSRIHVMDLAAAIAAAAAARTAGALNVCDDEPAGSWKVTRFAADLLGLEPPPERPFEEVKDSLSPMALSFYAERKRCRNTRLASLPGFALRYPTYREGLTALAAAGEHA